MRIYFNHSGPAVIALMEAGDLDAITEATHRGTPKVKAAYAAVPAVLRLFAALEAGAASEVATKTPKASRKAAKPVVDEVAKAAAKASAQAATALRNEAKAWKTEQYKAGIVVTTDEAYAHVGAVRFFGPDGRKA